MLVVCPGCNTNYSLDERTFSEAGTKLICRECGTETIVALPGTQEASRSQPFAAEPPPEPEPAAPAPRAATHAVATGATTCPSCGHRFIPGEQPIPAPAARAQSKLLLVEDQDYFIQLTRDALGPGFEITAVSDVPAARQALGGARFDLVILDLSLDDNQDGRGLLRSVHERSIPVLIFTACDESEFYGSAWEDLKAAGATDIVLKGVNVGEELKRKVVAIVGNPHAR